MTRFQQQKRRIRYKYQKIENPPQRPPPSQGDQEGDQQLLQNNNNNQQQQTFQQQNEQEQEQQIIRKPLLVYTPNKVGNSKKQPEEFLQKKKFKQQYPNNNNNNNIINNYGNNYNKKTLKNLPSQKQLYTQNQNYMNNNNNDYCEFETDDNNINSRVQKIEQLSSDSENGCRIEEEEEKYNTNAQNYQKFKQNSNSLNKNQNQMQIEEGEVSQLSEQLSQQSIQDEDSNKNNTSNITKVQQQQLENINNENDEDSDDSGNKEPKDVFQEESTRSGTLESNNEQEVGLQEQNDNNISSEQLKQLKKQNQEQEEYQRTRKYTGTEVVGFQDEEINEDYMKEQQCNLQQQSDEYRQKQTVKHTYSELYTIKYVGGILVNQRVYYKWNDIKFKPRKNKNFKYLLPKKSRDVLKTIILDMDETLLYSFPEIYTSKNTFYYNTVLRPHLLEFLRELRPNYEIVLFTAAEEDYTRRILIGFGLMEFFDHLLFRQHMTTHQIEYFNNKNQQIQVKFSTTKDLTFLGRQLRHVCIIDDKKQRFELQPNNGIEIPRWMGRNQQDQDLLYLKKFFVTLKNNEKAYQRFNFSKGSYQEYNLNFQEIKKFVLDQNL